MRAVQAKMGRLLGCGGGWAGSCFLLARPSEISQHSYTGQKPREKEWAAGESGEGVRPGPLGQKEKERDF